MNGTLGVIGGSFGAREFDRVHAAEVLDLGALRACSEPAAIPAANITAPRTNCAARLVDDVIFSSVIGTLQVYVRHAG